MADDGSDVDMTKSLKGARLPRSIDAQYAFGDKEKTTVQEFHRRERAPVA
jgi:hypothetical protein